jgi:hypothetical protein
MTEPGQRSQITSASQRVRAPRSLPEHGDPLGVEARALVERAARLPDGLELLLGSPLECAAVLLGAPPRVVERVRALLDEPRARAEARETFARAAARDAAPRAAPARPAPPRDPEALLLAAQGRTDGLAILLSASAECAAIAFAVHPDLVQAARDLAQRRGLVVDRPLDP